MVEEVFFPRDISNFLTELARAIHKHRMYPPAHPALRLALEPVCNDLNALLEKRDSLALLIGRSQIAVDDAETDPEHPVVSGLAAELHRHDIAELTFQSGIQESELGEFLALVSQDPRRSGRPLAQALATEGYDWPHLAVRTPDYQRLGLAWDLGADAEAGEEGAREKGVGLWRELAQGFLPTEEVEGAETEEVSPATVARSLDQRSADPAEARRLLERFQAASGELRTARGPEAPELRRRFSEVIMQLSSEALERFLGTANREERRELLHDGVRWMTPLSLVKVACATGELEERHISSTLLLLLAKLAHYSRSEDPEIRLDAAAGLREQVEELVTGWEQEESATGSYRAALERMALSSPEREEVRERTKGVAPERALRLGLLVNKVGPHVWTAATALMHARRFQTLVDTMAVGGSSGAAEEIWESLASARAVEWILKEELPSLSVLDPFIERLGLAAARPMLDAFVRSESPAVRQALHTRLAALGPRIGPQVAERLVQAPEEVRYRLLVLIDKIGPWDHEWTALPFIEDSDPDVRRQALKVLLRERSHRDRAICGLLAEEDSRAVALGLGAAQENTPPEAIPFLLTILQGSQASSGQRLMALRALAELRTPELLEPILDEVAWPRSRLLGRLRWRRLRAKSPLVLEGLRILSRDWPAAPRAQPALTRARRSADVEIRRAVAEASEVAP